MEPFGRHRSNNSERSSPLDDETLIARAREGDDDAFAELVRRYQDGAFRAAFLVLRDTHDAEDAAQEGILRAYRALPRFRQGSAFRPWLLKIVVNQALTATKARQRRQAVREKAAAEPAPGPYTIDETVMDRERARILMSALESLREQERVVIYLRYFLSLSEKELAEYLGCAPGTVKSRLHRALSKLRETVERSYPQLTGEPAQ